MGCNTRCARVVCKVLRNGQRLWDLRTALPPSAEPICPAAPPLSEQAEGRGAPACERARSQVHQSFWVQEGLHTGILILQGQNSSGHILWSSSHQHPVPSAEKPANGTFPVNCSSKLSLFRDSRSERPARGFSVAPFSTTDLFGSRVPLGDSRGLVPSRQQVLLTKVPAPC